MNICVISGLYATEKSPYGGIFVYEYLKQLRSHGLSYKTYVIRRDYSRGVALVYRIIKRKSLNSSTVVPWDESEPIISINCPANIFDMILYIYFPKQYLKIIFKKITDNVEIKSDTIIHAHWTYPEGYYAVKLAKMYQVPCVITAYGSDIHTLPQHNKTARKYLPKILENANKVTFMSNALLNSGINLGYSGENSAIIPVGVQTNIFYPIDKDSASKITGWRQTKKYVVGFVGNLIPIKRADCLPRIFSIIETKLEDVEFLIVGDGILRSSMQTECDMFGLVVTFTGSIPHNNVVNWMNLFDVMVLPSRKEGFGNVIIEANACGVPVVGSDAGGIPEALGGCGVAVNDGINFEKDFGDAVICVLQNLEKINKNNLLDHANNYNWDRIGQRYLEIYNEISPK